MKALICVAISCVMCAAMSLPARGQRRHSRSAAWGVPTIYSNLYLEAETGDVGGMEVILITSYRGDWASVVIGSGVAYDPVLVPVKRDGARVEFTLPDAGDYQGYGTFVGRETPTGLVLENHNLGKQVLRKQCR